LALRLDTSPQLLAEDFVASVPRCANGIRGAIL
jgi:hypothetical protein